MKLRQKRSRKYMPKHKKASDVRPLDIINVLIAIGSLIMTFLGWIDD